MNFEKVFFTKREISDHVLEYTFALPSTKGEELHLLAAKVLGTSKTTLSPLTKTHFPYNDLSNWIEACFSKTHDSCKFVLPNYSSQNTFFQIGHPPLCQSSNGYAALEGSNIFWYFIIRQNSILSAYDKLRRYVSGVTPLNTGADFLNFLLPFGADFTKEKNNERYGLYFLLTHENATKTPLATLDKNGFIHSLHFAKETSKQKNYYRSRNSRLTHTASALYEILTEHFNLSLAKIPRETSDQKHPLLQLHTLELYQCLAGRKEGKKNINFNTIFEVHKDPDLFNTVKHEKYIQEFQHFRDSLPLPFIETNEMVHRAPGINFELVDQIYCRYLTEKLLGLELTDCLYTNIIQHPKKDYLIGIIDFISVCFTLPNPFSRQLILQTALDNLRYLPGISKKNDCKEDTKSNNIPNQDIDDNLFYYADHGCFDDYTDEDNSVSPEEVSNYLRRLTELRQPPQEITTKTTLDAVPEYHEVDCMIPLQQHFNSLPMYSDTTRIQMEIGVWENNYTNLINKLTKHIFPVYDNYFFNTLWNSVRSSVNTDNQCAITLFKLLSDYLNNPLTVNILLNPDTIFKVDKPPLSTYDSSGIIKPFQSTKLKENGEEKKIDVELYKKCIKVSTTIKNTPSIPDFLNLNYLFPHEFAKRSHRETLEKGILFHNI